jgi:RNA polymerase sigma-70 factor (ECF subfamily)
MALDLTDLDDAQLILRSREDPVAFRVLYERIAPGLLRYFASRVHDAEVAADLLAETFALAYERRRRFRNLGRPGAAWVYGIARNELSHYFRHKSVDDRAVHALGLIVPRLDHESIIAIEAMADVDGPEPALGAAMARMTDVEREAVELRIVQELNYDEIAARLGCSQGSARTRVHRGLARLTCLLEVTRD